MNDIQEVQSAAPASKLSTLKRWLPVALVAGAALAGTAGAVDLPGAFDMGTTLNYSAIGESTKDTVQNVAKAGGGALAVSVAVRVGVKWVKRLAGFA